MTTPRPALRLLVIEDSPLDCELVLREVQRGGFDVEHRRVQDQSQLEQTLVSFSPDVILSDFTMPRFSGAEALSIVKRIVPDIPFIFVSGTIGEDRAVEAIKLGATDYILKDRLRRLVPAITRALEDAQARLQHRQAQAALRETEERFRSFMQHLPGSASVADAGGRYTYVNDNWLATFRKRAAEVVGRTHDEVWPQERAAALRAVHEQVIQTGQSVRRVFSADSSTGVRWWLSHHFPIPDASSNTSWVGTIAVDITEQKLQEEKIARLSRIQAVLSGINSAIVRIRNREELFDEACRIAVEHGKFGFAWIGAHDPQTLELIPVASAGSGTEELKLGRATSRDDVPGGQGLLGRVIRERRALFDNNISNHPRPDGKRRQEALRLGYRSLVVMPLFEHDAVVGTFSMFAKEPDFFNEEELRLLAELADDISFALEHIAREERLNYLACYDPLTGLANRAFFLDRLTHELQSAKQHSRRLALVLGDIRRLRFVNESFGRQVGDTLLCEMATRWKGIWPDPANVGRIAADCLAGILADIDEPAEVAHLLQGPVNNALTAPMRVEEKELGASLTIGIAIFPTDGEDAETLLRNADAALNKAKKHAEHYAFYQTEMNVSVAETLLLENKLRRAVEKQQFVLHYQPKVDVRSGAITSMEALIRWNDGAVMVPPGQFVPLLEETGLILDVGRWAIRKAVAEYAEWQRRGLQPPRIAVNVSAVQLRQNDFVDTVRSAIAEYGEHHGLDLEITESMIMHDIQGNIAKLHELRKLGVNLAIDDFGTGYSSLGYLGRLPVNALKIDRSFIAAMNDSADGMSIVSAIISLAHSLKLKVIAEGVESQEQRQLLTLLQCDEIQGYIISRPVPANEIEAFFEPTVSR